MIGSYKVCSSKLLPGESVSGGDCCGCTGSGKTDDQHGPPKTEKGQATRRHGSPLPRVHAQLRAAWRQPGRAGGGRVPQLRLRVGSPSAPRMSAASLDLAQGQRQCFALISLTRHDRVRHATFVRSCSRKRPANVEPSWDRVGRHLNRRRCPMLGRRRHDEQ